MIFRKSSHRFLKGCEELFESVEPGEARSGSATMIERSGVFGRALLFVMYSLGG